LNEYPEMLEEASTAVRNRIMATQRSYKLGHAMVIDAIMKTVHLVHKPTVDVDSVVKTMETLKGLYQPTTSSTIQVLESRMQLLQVQTTTASLADRLAKYFQCQNEIAKE